MKRFNRLLANLKAPTLQLAVWGALLIVFYFAAPFLSHRSAGTFLYPDIAEKLTTLETIKTNNIARAQRDADNANAEVQQAEAAFKIYLQSIQQRIVQARVERQSANDALLAGEGNAKRISDSGSGCFDCQDRENARLRARFNELNDRLNELEKSLAVVFTQRATDQGITQALARQKAAQAAVSEIEERDQKAIDKERLGDQAQRAQATEKALTQQRRYTLLMQSFVYGAGAGAVLVLVAGFLGWVRLPNQLTSITALAVTIVAGFCALATTAYYLSGLEVVPAVGEDFAIIWRALVAGAGCDIAFIAMRSFAERFWKLEGSELSKAGGGTSPVDVATATPEPKA